MNRSFFLFLLLLNVSVSKAQPPVDILHYRYDITVNDLNDSIKGTAYITFAAKESLPSLSLDLVSINNKGKGMLVQNVHLQGGIVPVNNLSQNAEKVVIQMPKALNTGDTVTAIINYTGIPADGLIISKNKYGHRTFFADNWPNRGHNWLPCIDEPFDKASVEFIVTAPAHYQVVANGIQVEETNISTNTKRTHWKENVPVATKVMVIGVADFAVSLAGTIDNCVPVTSWVYPEDRDKGFYDYEQAVSILPFFIKYAGPYGYKKLANVQSKTTFGGLENASAIFYSENSVTGTRKSESLIAHEIAHQWFGNMATEKSFAHLWLSEGFATYMTILYMESRYGADTAISMLREDREQVIAYAAKSNNPVVDSISSYMALLNTNSYQKGGWVLHMLRRQLGDSVFQKSIHNYYAAYAGKNADTKDFQNIVEKTSGRDLSQFFKQWLYLPGVPKLDIKTKYVAATNKIEVTVSQLQKNIFVFPLELLIQDATGGQQKEKLQVSKAVQTFVIAVKGKPVKMVADPGVSLLFEESGFTQR
jgi:aminopeptidase N